MTGFRPVSVLTLIRGRQRHFDHLLAGLKAQVRMPDELVVAYMQDAPPQMPSGLPFAVNCIRVPGDEMPLAKARNAAAQAAQGDVLAFLDVDCIADDQFVRRAGEVFEADDEGVYLPEVHYLPADETGWLTGVGDPDYPMLEAEAVRHPAKPSVFDEPATPIDDHGELWGLAFILHRDTWERAGGMDEGFIGYGAEETDFAQRLARIEEPIFWLGGTRCFHQHHTVHKPPLQHFDSIIRNARLFHERWGKWCMDYWLDDFESRGLIRRSDNELAVVRTPTEEEIAATRQGPDIRFS